MLELDFILERYLEQHYEAARDSEKHLFRDLLTAQDPELQAWLLNGQRHPDDALQQLIDKIRGI